MMEQTKIATEEAARLAMDTASEKQASNILMLDMRGPFGFTDYFVILTAESRRQMQALLEDIDQSLDSAGLTIHHREGTSDGGWVIMDYGNLVIHVFGPEERAFYNLEELWANATVLFRIQ